MTETGFKQRWQNFARERRLEDPQTRPLAHVTLSVAELRRDALEFYSWGVVDRPALERRLERLLPPPAAFVRRLPGTQPPDRTSGGL